MASKIMLVQHPKTGKKYAVFADAEVESNVGDGEGVVLLGVKRVAELYERGEGNLPLPIPVSELEGVRIVNDCIEQIAELARGFIK